MLPVAVLDGRLVIKEAALCRLHREEIALKFPSSRGCGHLGLRCEFYEGRRPLLKHPGLPPRSRFQ